MNWVVSTMVSIKGLKVKDVMKRTKRTARKDQRLSEVLGIMKRHGIHEVPVIEKGNLLGLIDLDHLIRSRRVPITSEVKNLLSNSPTLSVNDSIAYAAKMMIDTNHKAVPVTENGKFLGIVSSSDLVLKIPSIEEMKAISVKDIMIPDPCTVFESDTVDHARRMLRELDERTLPVTDKKGDLIGNIDILSVIEVLERQVLTKGTRARRIVGGKKRPRPLVRDIMKDSVAAIGQKAKLREIIKIMKDTPSTSVVITEKGTPIGLVSYWDLLEIMASTEDKGGVHIQITGLLHEDTSVYDAIYWFVQRFIKKTSRRVTPTLVTIHGIEHMKDGETVRYTVYVKVLTNKRTFLAKREGYELFGTLDECLGAIERIIKKKAGRNKSSRKGK